LVSAQDTRFGALGSIYNYTFSNTAGELRAFQSGSNWFVEGDTNGDGVADLVILVANPTAPLTVTDLLP
jgi:hypothetical protein